MPSDATVAAIGGAALGALCSSACWYHRSTAPKVGYKPAVAQTAAEGAEGLLRHVVMFRFRPDAPPASVQKVEEGFKRLATEIDVVKSFEWGCNNSPEPLSEGYSHVFFLTFEDEAARDAYLPHPKHQAFVDLLLGEGILDSAKVLDFHAQPVPTASNASQFASNASQFADTARKIREKKERSSNSFW